MKTTISLLFYCLIAAAQTGKRPPPPSKQYLKTRTYTADEDARVLKLYEGLRLCDVIDGLDVVGLQGVTPMDRNIRPMWRDEQNSTTVSTGGPHLRIVPAQETSPKFASHATERTWEAGRDHRRNQVQGRRGRVRL